MKVLYLYSGTRSSKFKGMIGIDYPDTPFYGLNHLSVLGIEAEFKEFKDVPFFGLFDPLMPFRLKHVILTKWYALFGGYDVIFGSSLMYGLYLKRIFRLRTKFVVLNISLNRTLAANKNKPLKRRLFVWLLKGADAVVCLAHVQKEDLEKEVPELKGRTHFVPLGVDVSYHQAAYSGRNAVLISAGRDNGRDYVTVCQAAALIPGMKLEIVCSPRNMVGVNDVPANVTVEYDLPPSRLYDRFGQSRALLLITHDDKHQDGADCSGQTVLLQAMAMGLPLIASRKRYLDDYVRDGQEALLVDFYSPEDISAKLKLLDQPGLSERLARSARMKVEQSFSTQKMAEGVAAVFKDLFA